MGRSVEVNVHRGIPGNRLREVSPARHVWLAESGARKLKAISLGDRGIWLTLTENHFTRNSRRFATSALSE